MRIRSGRSSSGSADTGTSAGTEWDTHIHKIGIIVIIAALTVFSNPPIRNSSPEICQFWRL
jgi:hypothetical protein